MKIPEDKKIKMLLRFLKNEKVYSIFKQNTSPQTIKNFNYIQWNNPLMMVYLQWAFTWCTTPQGHLFWADICNKVNNCEIEWLNLTQANNENNEKI